VPLCPRLGGEVLSPSFLFFSPLPLALTLPRNRKWLPLLTAAATTDNLPRKARLQRNTTSGAGGQYRGIRLWFPLSPTDVSTAAAEVSLPQITRVKKQTTL